MNIEMNENRFNTGIAPDAYAGELRNYRSLVRRLIDEAPTPPPLAAEFKAAVGRFEQPVRATIMTEDWCGDSACNFPLLWKLCDAAGVPLRIFRGSEHPEFKEAYERDGDDHIPAVSFWDGSGSEIARWIEAPESIDEKKAAWKAERPHFMELYAKQREDKEAAKQFASLYRELLETMAGWYTDGAWSDTAREIVERLSR